MRPHLILALENTQGDLDTWAIDDPGEFNRVEAWPAEREDADIFARIIRDAKAGLDISKIDYTPRKPTALNWDAIGWDMAAHIAGIEGREFSLLEGLWK